MIWQEHGVLLEMSCPVNGYKISSIWCPPDVFVGLPCLLWMFCRLLQQRISFCGRCRQNLRHAAFADVSFQRTTHNLLLFLLCQYTTVGFVAVFGWGSTGWRRDQFPTAGKRMQWDLQKTHRHRHNFADLWHRGKQEIWFEKQRYCSWTFIFNRWEGNWYRLSNWA